MDYTVHGILQARILEWVAFPFSRGSYQPRDQSQVSCIAGGFFTSWAKREAPRRDMGLNDFLPECSLGFLCKFAPCLGPSNLLFPHVKTFSHTYNLWTLSLFSPPLPHTFSTPRSCFFSFLFLSSEELCLIVLFNHSASLPFTLTG